MRHGQKQCLEGHFTQEIQSNTLKCPPHTHICFIPEGISVPDVEEIQDSKEL